MDCWLLWCGVEKEQHAQHERKPMEEEVEEGRVGGKHMWKRMNVLCQCVSEIGYDNRWFVSFFGKR